MAYQSKPEKLKTLQDLNRDEFVARVLLPLLKRMGYERIAYRHPEGQNPDAMLRYEERFGEILYAFLIAKLPAISSENLDIPHEVLANFERTFADEQGTAFKPKECIIATSGQIDDEVVQAIQRFSSEHHYAVRLLDGRKISQLDVFWQHRSALSSLKYELEMQKTLKDRLQMLTHELKRQSTLPMIGHTMSIIVEPILEILGKDIKRNYHQVRAFFQKAGFAISDEINPFQFSVHSENPVLKRYGTIPVQLLHYGKTTAESIRQFYTVCMSKGIPENGLGFITVPPQLDTAVSLQMFVHRSESGFTIVPFTIYAIEQALYEDRCLKTVFDTIKLWKGEADLFGFSTPIRDPLWFIGRERVIDEIQEYIQSLQFVGIWGLRKVGKTSLLYQLMRKMENDLHAYVDLQAVSPNVGALFSKVVDGFERDIQLKFPDIKLPRLKKTFKTPLDGVVSAFTDAILKLHERVEAEKENAKFILFIDEVDRLFPNAEGDASGFSEYSSFLAAIRGLSQNYGFFVCVASGVEPTINHATLPGGGSVENPTYNFFKEIYLSYFEQEEMDEMIERIASQLGIAFTVTALNFIYEQTHGHPYLSRLLCSAIMKIREKKPKITINEARQGLQFLLSSSIVTEGARHLRWLWDYLSDEDKEIIRNAKTNQLKTFLSANEVEHLTEAVNKLIRLGYLEPTAEGYRILPPIFEKYLVGTGLI